MVESRFLSISLYPTKLCGKTLFMFLLYSPVMVIQKTVTTSHNLLPHLFYSTPAPLSVSPSLEVTLKVRALANDTTAVDQVWTKRPAEHFAVPML